MGKLIFTDANNSTEQLANRVKRGELVRIRQKVYLAIEDEPNLLSILNEEWIELVKHLAPKSSIISYRTAAELKPHNGVVFLNADVSSQRKVEVTDGFELIIYKERSKVCTHDFLGIPRSADARLFLENLIKGRANTLTSERSLGQEWVEHQICKYLEKYQEKGLNELRDLARSVALELDLDSEFEQLNKIISSVLSTNTEGGVLTTQYAISVSKRAPYDLARVDYFNYLKGYLENLKVPFHDYSYAGSSWKNFAFFESYFSNYIEGTEFEVSEAAKIVFQDDVVAGRHEDSHDIRSVYDLASDYQEMSTTPDSVEDFFKILQNRHFLMMKERPDKRPGEFKNRINKAGNTTFVAPADLEGTLTQGFDIYKSLSPGFNRAVFMQFLVAECHPFDDGNGRISRLMMNAELTSAGLQKIIIPNVHRDSYLNGLRTATRGGNFRVLVKVLHQLHCYSASIPWNDYAEARDKLERDSAFSLPDEGVPVFNEVIREFKYDYPL